MLSGALRESFAGLFYLCLFLILHYGHDFCLSSPQYMSIISAPLSLQNPTIVGFCCNALLCHLCGVEGGEMWVCNCSMPVAFSVKRNSIVLTIWCWCSSEYYIGTVLLCMDYRLNLLQLCGISRYFPTALK